MKLPTALLRFAVLCLTLCAATAQATTFNIGLGTLHREFTVRLGYADPTGVEITVGAFTLERFQYPDGRCGLARTDMRSTDRMYPCESDSFVHVRNVVMRAIIADWWNDYRAALGDRISDATLYRIHTLWNQDRDDYQTSNDRARLHSDCYGVGGGEYCTSISRMQWNWLSEAGVGREGFYIQMISYLQAYNGELIGSRVRDMPALRDNRRYVAPVQLTDPVVVEEPAPAATPAAVEPATDTVSSSVSVLRTVEPVVDPTDPVEPMPVIIAE